MSSAGAPQGFPNVNQPLVDGQQKITRPWFGLLSTLYKRGNVSGTFVANGSSEVTIANSNVTSNSVIIFGLKTASGSITGAPFQSSVSPGVGFGVKASSGDTSAYSYLISGG